MSGMWAVQLFTYLAVAVLVVGLALKAVKYARTPLHLRWELYPVPGEKSASHGGSYFEEPDWWTKPREKSLAAELRAMLSEILLIKSLWHHNRQLWYFSYPFHGGIYLVVAFIVLLLVGAIAEALGATVSTAAADSWAAALAYLTIVVGVLGFLGVAIGSLGLLNRRVTNEDIRGQSTPADYFNLVFILAVALSALFAWGAADPSFVLLRAYLRGLLTLSPADSAGHPAIVAEVLLLSAFFLYLPFTHMTHFVAKFFTYHMVRWDDTPNLKGSSLEAKIKANLGRPVSWSAAHIGVGATWAEVASSTEPRPQMLAPTEDRDKAAQEVS